MQIVRVPVGETNCYLLRDESGVVVVDPGPPGGTARVTVRAEEEGIRPQDVRLIFVTHGHLDHYGAAPGVKAWCGAPVAAFAGEPEFSQDPRNALPPAQTLRGSIIRWLYLRLSPLARFAPLEADLLLEPGTSLQSYGLAAETVPLPGHSPGSLGLVTTEGDVLVGDLFVNYAVPSQPLYLSDREAWERSYERVRALKPRMVYIGHGEPFAGDRLAQIYPARYQFRWWVR
jgi:glyoxylase-like metal-dependent hydrolase (beta-lactamase superfamily II)